MSTCVAKYVQGTRVCSEKASRRRLDEKQNIYLVFKGVCAVSIASQELSSTVGALDERQLHIMVADSLDRRPGKGLGDY